VIDSVTVAQALLLYLHAGNLILILPGICDVIALGILMSVRDGEATFDAVHVRGAERASLRQIQGCSPLFLAGDFYPFWTSFDWTRSKTDYDFDAA
jgi:hypothetical protein